MRSIKVIFDDGDSLLTNINGTDEEIKSYYLGADGKGLPFNVGFGPGDNMKKTTEVIFLD